MSEPKPKKKQWLLWVLGLVVGVFLFKGIFQSSTPVDTTTTAVDTASVADIKAEDLSPSSVDKALVEIKKEPKVLEALVTEANFLYVGVKDDGTRRDGYAEYLCQVLKNNNASTIKAVKVVKFNSTNDPKRDNAYGVLLGQAYCQ